MDDKNSNPCLKDSRHFLIDNLSSSDNTFNTYVLFHEYIASIIELCGNTPLIQLKRMNLKKPKVKIYCKLEWFNPSGSVKDRSIFNIIDEAERNDQLKNGMTILDSSSGNAGISYALAGNVKGYDVLLTIPRNVSPERLKILKSYGAKVILTNPSEGSDGAIRKAREIYESNPKQYFYGKQYDRAANWIAHYQTTGPEIIKQTSGKITHFITGIGTSGTLMGTGKKLKEYSSKIKVISMAPDGPFHGLEGLKHMETSIVPGIYDSNFADRHFEVSTSDAQKTVKETALKEGLLVGTSSGAAVCASQKLAEEIDEGVIVTVLPDAGYKYFSEKYWDDI